MCSVVVLVCRNDQALRDVGNRGFMGYIGKMDHRVGMRVENSRGDFLWQDVETGWTSCVARVLWVGSIGFVVVTC